MDRKEFIMNEQIIINYTKDTEGNHNIVVRSTDLEGVAKTKTPHKSKITKNDTDFIEALNLLVQTYLSK